MNHKDFPSHEIRRLRSQIDPAPTSGSFLSFHEVAAYCVSKAGVAMLTRALGCEWAPFNVNVNAIAPGVFRTPLNAKLLDIPETHWTERDCNAWSQGDIARWTWRSNLFLPLTLCRPREPRHSEHLIEPVLVRRMASP